MNHVIMPVKARGKYIQCLVDYEDFLGARHHSWCLGSHGYPTATINGKRHLLHHFIKGRQGGKVVDHINRNKLDNRSSNLRHITHSENLRNREPSKGTSSYRGVSWDKDRGKWVAGYKKPPSGPRTPGKRVALGRFDNEIDAAIAYDNAVYEEFGDMALLNFDRDTGQVRGK